MTPTSRSIHVAGASHKAPIPAAARVGPILATSAVSGKDPVSGELPSDPEQQVRNTFANLQAVLQAGGASMDDVVKFSITIKHNAVRDAINTHWLATFPNPEDRPARHIVVSDLQHGMELQIEALAFIR